MTYKTLTSTFALSLFLGQSPVLASETILEEQSDLTKSIRVLQENGLDEDAVKQLEAATKSGATSEEIEAVKTQLTQLSEAQESGLWAAISYLRNYFSKPQEGTDEKKLAQDVTLTPQTETLPENVQQLVSVSTQTNAETKDVPEVKETPTSQGSEFSYIKPWTWNWRSSGATEEESKPVTTPVTLETTPSDKKDTQ